MRYMITRRTTKVDFYVGLLITYSRISLEGVRVK